MMKRRVISIIMCISLFFCITPTYAFAETRDVSLEESLASDLKELGLFRGVSDTNFDLEREPTRVEALVMLIRVLGKEEQALSGVWNHPFTDVPSWADLYVGYAYTNGLTNGVSSTEFGIGNATAAQYLTFVLRALDYSDVNGVDFTWNNPFALAKNIGILPERVNTDVFWRADVVTVSYAALATTLKGSTQTLAQKLINAGVFSSVDFEKYYDVDALYVKSGCELNAQEIYKLCSPAVFLIKTYDVDGNAYATGSGFFIDKSGIAVTNHHVLKNAVTAEAILTDGRKCDISGVLYFDNEVDYAVIKIDGSDFPTVKIGNSSTVTGGETVYAIGNPRGLTNSISDGIVSNPNRQDLGGMMQVTTPISPGSSGGALINTKGEVIGVTTACLESGQNLNFAVPINSVMPDEDIRFFEKNHGIFSMKEYAEYNEYLDYENIPSAFQYVVNESEPNDTIDSGNYIVNGTSVAGTITDEYMDVFIVHCNTVGKIEIALFSESSPKYVKDLILVVEPIKTSGAEGASSNYYSFEDGTAGRMLTYVIPRAGVYAIHILSNSLYKSEKLNTDYQFYYRFIPGATDGTNTSGSNGSFGNQANAFNALKSWITDNYTDKISGDKAYIQRDTISYRQWVEYGVIYDDTNDKMVLYCGQYNSGAEAFSYIWVGDTGQYYDAAFSYYAKTGYGLTFTGQSQIYAPEFSLDSPYAFSNTSGQTTNLQDLTERAQLMHCISIEFVNILFENLIYPIGTYTMDDFGFYGV